MASVEEFYGEVVQYLKWAEAQLGKDEELEGYYCPGPEGPIRIRELGYRNPDLIVLNGATRVASNERVLVHMGSFRLVLKVRKRRSKVEAKPKQPIGFVGPLPLTVQEKIPVGEGLGVKVRQDAERGK